MSVFSGEYSWRIYPRYIDIHHLYRNICKCCTVPDSPTKKPLENTNEACQIRMKEIQDWLNEVVPPQIRSQINHYEGKTPHIMTINDFFLKTVIGKGSSGKIYLAKEKSTNHLYALKKINKEQSQSRHNRNVFRAATERNVLATLNSDFITKLYYAFQDSYSVYFVIDYCAGGDLYYRLFNIGRIDDASAKFYISEISYADLKPENVLIDKDGHIKLADFGLSKIGNLDGQRENSICGTPEYLAPEIIENQNYTLCVDWWSLGVLLHEMLPFPYRDTKALYNAILNDPIKIPPYLNQQTRSFISQLLERDPTKRLGSGTNGNTQIKQHIYFNDIDWEVLSEKKLVPPWVPQLKSNDDTQYFDRDATSNPIQSPLLQPQPLSFHGFVYVKDVTPTPSPFELADIDSFQLDANDIDNDVDFDKGDTNSN